MPDKPLRIDRLLVVIDPTADLHPCLQKAERIARRFGSLLELYICDAEMDVPADCVGHAEIAGYRARILAQHRDSLERLARALRSGGLAVETCVERHLPLEEGIGHHIIRSRPDLVVKDTHRHAMTGRGAVSHTDWNLMRQTAAPLLLVRPEPWPDRPRLVAAVDPSHPDDHPASLDALLVNLGRTLAEGLQGDLELLHVLGEVPHIPGEPVAPEQRQQAHRQSTEAVFGLALWAGLQKDAVHIQKGSAHDQIVDYVTLHQPAMLLMGAGARARWSLPPGGSATTVFEQTGCDLLVCKPPGFISPLLVTQ